MQTTSAKKLFGPDLLRAVAILLVFLWHFRRYGMPGWLEGLSKFGWTGVDLFFVLSGFLIGSQLLEKIAAGNDIGTGEFYMKRFFRIVPAYLAVLLLYLFIPGFSEREGMAPAWKFWTFTMNFGLDYAHAGSFSHAWSLCIEEQFYLALPLIILLLTGMKAGQRSVLLLLAFLFIAGFFIRAYCWNTYVSPLYASQEEMGMIGNTYSKYIYYPTYNRLDGLLAGITIALVFTYRPVIKEKLLQRSNLLLLLGVLILTGAYFASREQFAYLAAVISYPMVSLGYALILIAALSPRSILQKLNSKVFTFLAMISYSFYLVHKQVNHLVTGFLDGKELNTTLLFFTCLSCSLLAALILHLAVERPFLMLRQRLLLKRKLKQAATTG